MNLKSVFASRLRAELNHKKLKQKFLADALNVTESTVSGWLDPLKEVFPSFQHFREICQSLNVSADALLGLSEPILPSTRAELLDKVRSANKLMLGVHYAVVYDEVNRWREEDASTFFRVNQSLASKGVMVKRVFILRKNGMENPRTRKFDVEARQIIEEQAKTLTSVFVVWEHDALNANSDLLCDFVLLDEDTLFIDRHPGYTLLTWIPDKTHSLPMIQQYLKIFDQLVTIGIDVSKSLKHTSQAIWWK